MITFGALRQRVRTLAESAKNSEVRALAEIIEHLCTSCEDVEQSAKEAMDEAKRSRRH